jgi:hypothetical protein
VKIDGRLGRSGDNSFDLVNTYGPRVEGRLRESLRQYSGQRAAGGLRLARSAKRRTDAFQSGQRTAARGASCRSAYGRFLAFFDRTGSDRERQLRVDNCPARSKRRMSQKGAGRVKTRPPILYSPPELRLLRFFLTLRGHRPRKLGTDRTLSQFSHGLGG